MKLPDGVVDLRKVRTVLSGEDPRAHLTWVIAYNAQIEPGSERYEAIRLFGGALKPPRNTDQSVMYLPIAPPDTSKAPPPQPARKRTKPRARPAARAARNKSRTTARAKPLRKVRSAKPARAKSRRGKVAKSKPARSPARRSPSRARKARR